MIFRTVNLSFIRRRFRTLSSTARCLKSRLSVLLLTKFLKQSVFFYQLLRNFPCWNFLEKLSSANSVQILYVKMLMGFYKMFSDTLNAKIVDGKVIVGTCSKRYRLFLVFAYVTYLLSQRKWSLFDKYCQTFDNCLWLSATPTGDWTFSTMELKRVKNRWTVWWRNE